MSVWWLVIDIEDCFCRLVCVSLSQLIWSVKFVDKMNSAGSKYISTFYAVPVQNWVTGTVSEGCIFSIQCIYITSMWSILYDFLNLFCWYVNMCTVVLRFVLRSLRLLGSIIGSLGKWHVSCVCVCMPIHSLFAPGPICSQDQISQ